MKTVNDYIASCLKRSDSEINYFLQCQSCSGSAQEKIAFKILKAEHAIAPTVVIWFGDGFDPKFLETCANFPVRGNYLGLLSVEEFCTKALAGAYRRGQ